jgi:hypothetical protein
LSTRAHAGLRAARGGALVRVLAAATGASVLLVMVLSAGGCSPSLKSQGRTGITAAYRFGELRADLPDRVRVEAVLAAAESALISRGYSIRERAGTADEGRVVAEGPTQRGVSAVRVSAYVTGVGTRVAVFVGPLGDEDASRAILDAVLARMGV